ncbi:MAG: hypothetical protein IJ327_06835 [Lachnospiraceae bacterium]|nr:hypothetical protein [Lachnospiraceae bacterium]
MGEMIIRDYFRAFRWSKFKDVFWQGGFWIIYMGVIFPFCGGFTEKGEYYVTFQMIFLPCLFGFISCSLHPMELPKAMFLCPMSNGQRRDYVVQSCIFRICFTGSVGLLFTLGMIGLGLCDVVSGVALLGNYICLALLLCGFNERKGRTEEERNRSLLEHAGLRSGVEIADALCIILCSFGIACVLCWDTTPAPWVKWVFLAVVLLVECPLTAYFMKGWKAAVERAVSYEASNC